MTGEFFDRLLYTDCKPGTGRGAGGGFQVQAQSPGVGSAQSDLAISSLLYEVQLPWTNQQRPVEDFPLGLAHAGSECYGTAQGRYVGRTAAGTRMGNHLADCLLTRDPAMYGSVRPAQLWRSGFWRDTPWDSKDCPQFGAADLAPGPLTVDAVADWARSVPERGPVLARLVSLLEDPGGRRVVIVSDSPDEAVTWIAAATLLLPARHALDLAFKVFSAAPLSAKHRIVAAPAELYPRITPGLGGQRWVLDARTNRSDEAPVSERAAFFGGLFTDADEDPYDVADAVELAGALGNTLDDRDAWLTAWALTKPGDPRPEPGALFRWLSGASPGLLAEHGTPVAELILSDGADARTLRWLDGAIADKRLDTDPAAVRLALLSAEVAEIRGGAQPPVADVLPPVPLDASAHRDAESELSSALLLGGQQQADLLLCLSRRHGIEPELAPPLQQRLRDFAGSWINRPGAYHPDWWALRAEILDCTHDELRHRAVADGIESVAAIIRRLNRYFADRADVTDTVDCHIQASLIADRRLDGRIQRLRQLLGGIGRLAESRDLAPVAATAAVGLQRALRDWNAVDGDVAVTIAADMPGSLPVERVITDLAVERLEQMSARPSAALLDLLASLEKRGKPLRSAVLLGLLEADQFVRGFTRRALEENPSFHGEDLKETVGMLLDADPAVIHARADDVLAALLGSRDPRLAPAVLANLRHELTSELVARWADTLGTRDLVSDGLWCVRCLGSRDLPRKVSSQLKAAAHEYTRRLPRQELEQWYADVKHGLRPEAWPVWDSVITMDGDR
jgi:GTPase-associated protein 1, N-terminal domain type 2/GTPase-associated protein 1, middle domain